MNGLVMRHCACEDIWAILCVQRLISSYLAEYFCL